MSTLPPSIYRQPIVLLLRGHFLPPQVLLHFRIESLGQFSFGGVRKHTKKEVRMEMQPRLEL